MRESYPPFLSFLVVLLFICLLIGPVSASWPIDNGTMVRDQGFLTCQTTVWPHTGSDPAPKSIPGIWFTNIENFPTFTYLKLWHDGKRAGTSNAFRIYNTSSNNSYQILGLSTFEPGTNTERLVSTGIYGYSMGTNNNIYLYYFADTWNISGLSGSVILNFTYSTDLLDEFDVRVTYDDAGATPGQKYNVTFASSPVVPAFPRSVVASDAQEAGYDDTWRNDWWLYKDSQSSPVLTFAIRKVFNRDDVTGNPLVSYWSNLTFNATVNNKPMTLIQNSSMGNITGGWPYWDYYSGISDNFYPYYINVTDYNGNYYEKWIYGKFNYTQQIQVSVDKGETCEDSLQMDTLTTARMALDSQQGVRYLVWRWSENWDTFKSGTSSTKQKNNAYVSYQFNTTNGTWQKIAYGFDTKGVTPASTAMGSYQWAQIRTQEVQFNWSYYDPSWPSSPEKPYPYNFVEVSIYDENSHLLGTDYQTVCVSKSPTMGQFHIYVLDSVYGKVADANIFAYDTDAEAGIEWVAYNVNATYGEYILDVNVSHNINIWSSKAGYWFMGGEEYPGRIPQTPINGCVTYSLPFPGVKEIGLLMQNVNAANYTIMFAVESEPDDLISGLVRVPNAKITITSSQTSDVIYTDANGIANYQIMTAPNLEYSYRVEYVRDVECTQVREGTLTNWGNQYIYVLLDACSVITTVPTVTPTATPTEPGGGGVSEACASQNPIDAFKCLFEAAGAPSGAYAGMMLALVICAALAFIFGYYISFQASLIGAFVGFVFCIAFGLIPMWILIAMIFIGGVFFTGKWWSGGAGG